ncbi:MAG: ATP-dependent 6-phosphofructokinase [Firmicutes bacterium]|nr:ATP-dependent 6-phosphofructokinase [Bacillota bacterium]
MTKRVAVLTGGGDAPGLNAVIRAIVRSAEREYNYEVIGFKDGFKGVIEDKVVFLSENDVSGILPKGGTILGTTNRDNPFDFPVGNGRTEDKSQECIDTIRKYADSLIVIGGDGTLSIGNKLYKMGLPVVGCPKTIDNDLRIKNSTTFGFDTAYAYATEALDRLHSTAESHHRIVCLEVMGRNAGWIALHAGIAGGADVILIPEIPFNYEKIIEKINERLSRNKKFSLIVVAEGAVPEGGNMIYQNQHSDDVPLRLGGIGNVIAQNLEKMTEREARAIVLGHLQRGGSPTAHDRILATRYGTAAMNLTAQEKYGNVVSLDNGMVVPVPLSEATNGIKTVEKNNELVKTARSIGISFGD